MNELRSIFDLAFMSADLYHGGGPGPQQFLKQNLVAYLNERIRE